MILTNREYPLIPLIPLPFNALQKKEAPLSKNLLGYRGKTGIRTLGTVARSPHFECGPIDHSGIFPFIAAQK